MASLPRFAPEAFAPEAPTPAARAPLALVPPARRPAAQPPLDMDLPPALIRLMVAGFTAFMGLMALTFFADADGMGILLAICFVCLIGYFGLPCAMARAAPAAPRRTLADLLRGGVALPDGPCHGKEAVGLVLLLPAILIGWALFVAAMHAALL